MSKSKPETKTVTMAQILELAEKICRPCKLKETMGCDKADCPVNMRKFVSEAEHQAKIKEIEANELKAIKLAEKVVGENAKLKTENESLKLDRDGLLEITQYTSENLNTYAKWLVWEKQRTKILVGENAKLRERLEAIKSPEMLEKLAELEHEQWIEWSKAIAPEINIGCYSEHLKRWNEWWVPYSRLTEEVKEYDRVWARKVLGVLVFEPKGLDQKTGKTENK